MTMTTSLILTTKVAVLIYITLIRLYQIWRRGFNRAVEQRQLDACVKTARQPAVRKTT